MKKRRFWLVALSLLFAVCVGLCFAACDEEEPKTDTPTVENPVEDNPTDENPADDNPTDDNPTDEPADEPVKLGTPVVTVFGDGRVTWEKVENASKYSVKIGEVQSETEALSAMLKNGEKVSVQAVGDGEAYSSGDFSAPKTYRAPASNLGVPENLTIEIQGIDAGKVVLSWDEVEGASGYKIAVNGVEQNAEAAENTATVDLSEIDATGLNSVWAFRVKALGNALSSVADDGDYSARFGSGNYCTEAEFFLEDDLYTVAELLEIMNYFGDRIPTMREFMVTGTIETNANGNAVLEGGFTLFGKDVPELYLAIDGRLNGLEVTAIGTLTKKEDAKGLSSYRAVDFEGLADTERYALVIDTFNEWDKLKEDSQITGDFYLPVKLYGVNVLWDADDEETGAFEVDEYGDVTVTCPAEGSEGILVMLSAMLYIDKDREYDGELNYMVTVSAETRIQLAAPKININPKTGVATWNEIEHAVGYFVSYYGFSDPDDYYSEYVWEEITIPADGERAVQLKDTWWISVKALGDGVTYRDSEVDPKQYNYYPETTEPDGTPLTFDFTVLTQTGELANANYIFGLACGNAGTFVSASAERVVLGNDDNNGAVTGTGFIKAGSSNNKGKITLNFNKKINGVVITARQWNKNQNDKISVNGSAEQTASKNDWGVTYYNFTASKASTSVEINTNNRVFIQSITVYVAE